MAGSTIDVREARAALANLPDGTSHGETPAPEHVYLPRSHLKAMAPDCLLVTGMRGAGEEGRCPLLPRGATARRRLHRGPAPGASEGPASRRHPARRARSLEVAGRGA